MQPITNIRISKQISHMEIIDKPCTQKRQLQEMESYINQIVLVSH